MTQKPDPNQPSPMLIELQAIRRELEAVQTEVSGLRRDLKDKKTFQITDQVAKGVVIAGVFWIVLWNVLQVLLSA